MLLLLLLVLLLLLLLLLSLSCLHSFSASSAAKVGGSLFPHKLSHHLLQPFYLKHRVLKLFKVKLFMPCWGMLWGILFLAGSAFQSLLWKALLSQDLCMAGSLLNGKLPKRSWLSQSLSLPKEACPMQASFPFVPWMMLSLERLRRNRVSGSVLLGPPSWHRGSFPILPDPIASELTMLHAMQAKEKPKKQRDRSSATMLSFTASFLYPLASTA